MPVVRGRRLALSRGMGLGLGFVLGLAALPVAARQAAKVPPTVVPVAINENSVRAFVVRLLRLLGQAAGIEWKVEPVPFARALALAERGQALAFGVSRTAQREALFEFSEPLFHNHVWMVARREQGLDYRTLDDLRNRTLCLTRGFSYGTAFDAARAAGLFRVEQSDADLAGRARMLLADRCDLVLGSHRSPNPWLFERRLRESSGLAAALAVLPTPMLVEPVHLAVARGHPLAALLPRINAALAQQRPAIQALVDSDL